MAHGADVVGGGDDRGGGDGGGGDKKYPKDHRPDFDRWDNDDDDDDEPDPETLEWWQELGLRYPFLCCLSVLSRFFTDFFCHFGFR